jgi:hypothetical protein
VRLVKTHLPRLTVWYAEQLQLTLAITDLYMPKKLVRCEGPEEYRKKNFNNCFSGETWKYKHLLFSCYVINPL